MTGIDSSTEMLELARQRLGATAALNLSDLASPLPFPDGPFGGVFASLVLHYLEDWTAPLAERRARADAWRPTDHVSVTLVANVAFC